MKTSKWLVIAMAATLAVGGISVIKTHAAPPAGPLAQRRGAVLARVKEKLGLTDEQIGKIKAELRAEKDPITDLLKRLQTARAGLRDTIQQDRRESGFSPRKNRARARDEIKPHPRAADEGASSPCGLA